MEPAASFLNSVGAEVRAARARHGMTRRDLARQSEVSERHLAQLESGRGNISILLLRQVARALSVPVADLLQSGGTMDADRRLLNGLLDSLGPGDIAEARRLLERRFAERPARNERLALIGLRGAGKSSVGRLVAQQVGAGFVELAEEIEAQAGMAVGEIFEIVGQAGFRRHEREALTACLSRQGPMVLSTGGGVVSDPTTFQLLLSGCYTLWLQASPEQHMARVVNQGDHRPMAGSRQAMRDLRQILEYRTPLYAQADAVVDTTEMTPETVADRAAELWQAARQA